jgi:hypothetical protein
MDNILEGIAWSGQITATVVGPDGKMRRRVVFRNLITDAGLNLMRDGLLGTAVDLKIKRMAVGTNATAPAASDTQLGAEVFRKGFLREAQTGTGLVYTQVILASGEANVNIQELGWFAGPSATDTANSGILVARTLFSHNKTVGESIYMERVDTLARG